MTERTVTEIRRYCKAASEGPWQAEMLRGVPWRGLVRDKDGDCSIVQDGSEADVSFIANARTDLPRLLDVAVKLREALERCMADGTGWNFAVEIKGRLALDETAWLADSPEPADSPDGENEEENEYA